MYMCAYIYIYTHIHIIYIHIHTHVYTFIKKPKRGLWLDILNFGKCLSVRAGLSKGV